MRQSRYGDGSAGGRRIVDLPEPIDKAFGLPGLSALKTSAKTVGVGQTANALGSIVKPKIASGLQTATSTPLRTAATIGGTAAVANLAGRRSGRNQVYNGLAKGWGADSTRRLMAIEARGGQRTAGDKAAHEHYLRAWRKFTNLQERSNSGEKISPMRSRSFAPLENQLPGYGGRTGTNWEFNGNKRVRKAYIPEPRRQRRLGMYEAGLGLTGAAAGIKGANGIRRTTASSRHAAKLTSKWKDQGTHAALKHGLTARPKDIALVGGGAALLGGAGLVRQHAEGKNNRRWS